MNALEGRILSPAGWIEGSIRFDRRVLELIPGRISAQAPWIVPGFIDVHVHGGGGADTMDGEDEVLELARFHASHGTTALLPTTITNPWLNVLEALRYVRRAMKMQSESVQIGAGLAGARVLGAHLEGPFISPKRLGAQPPFTLEPTPERLAEALEFGVIRVVTLAPEINRGLEAAQAFAAAGVRVSVGHTAATTEQVELCLEVVHRSNGVASGTHLFNAMGGLEGRNPGVVGALLGNPRAWAEVILDGHHVHASSFRTAVHAKPERLMLITDAIRAAGMPEGEYDLGGQTVFVRNGIATLEGGSLAGSLLTMDLAVRNAVKAGLSLETAVKLASAHPAAYLGLEKKGSLTIGHDADIVVLNEHLNVSGVHVEGRQVA
jgi:N-acetylglucosamine-6-phosphate deacetylase